MTILQTELGCDQYFPSYKHFFCPKFAVQNVLQRDNLKILFEMRLRSKNDCKVIETHLK